jgi:hypothetical protein
MQMLNWNLAEEYAKHFHIPGQTSVEPGWQFRERVALGLLKMEEPLLAHEVLYNRRMSCDLFARGELSSGYGDAFITQIARRTERAFQRTRQQQEQRKRQQRLLSILCFWQKLEAG